MLTSEIIQELNGDRVHRFPSLDLWLPIDARLSAYRSDKSWALVIEVLTFNDRRCTQEQCTTEFWCYGDSLPQEPGYYHPELHVVGDGPSGPLFDAKISSLISPAAKDMRIRDKVVPITLDPAEYAAAGIDLKLLLESTDLWPRLEAALAEVNVSLGRPPRIYGYELLRLIAPKHRRLFFATEAEINERIGESMPLLLRLDEWQHPGINEEPYLCESFHMIADVIAHNDPSLYQPTEPPNTHWSNWPMAGTV